MSASTHRSVILGMLHEAYPMPVGPTELEAITPKYQARVDELHLAGWDIDTHHRMEHGRAGYGLASLVQGPPDRVLAGCTLRVGSRAGTTSRTHREARRGPVPVEVLMEAEQAALDAYLAVVGEHLPEVEGEDSADQIRLVSSLPGTETTKPVTEVFDLDEWLAAL